jgi:hypothetical protein
LAVWLLPIGREASGVHPCAKRSERNKQFQFRAVARLPGGSGSRAMQTAFRGIAMILAQQVAAH